MEDEANENAPLTPAQKQELERRIELYKTADRADWKTLDQINAELNAERNDIEEVPLTPAQMAELERRIALDDAGQAIWIPFEEIEAELKRRKRK